MKVARLFLAKYTLRNGTRGTLHVIAASSCDAVVVTMHTFGGNLRTCSARPHPSP